MLQDMHYSVMTVLEALWNDQYEKVLKHSFSCAFQQFHGHLMKHIENQIKKENGFMLQR